MNKQMLSIVIIVILLALGGGFLFLNKKASPTTPSTTANTQTAVVTQPQSMFTSIQDALSRSLSLKCEYKTTDDVSAVTYIKNGAIRSDTVVNGVANSSTLMKDKKMYVWTNNTKTGFMMDLSTITPASGTAGAKAPTSNDYQKSMSALEQYKDSCKQAVVADSLFTAPTDIKFADYSNMIKNMMPSGIPSTYP